MQLFCFTPLRALFILLLAFSHSSQAEVLNQATLALQFSLSKAPTTRPMTVAYHPILRHYYVADGGLAPMGNEQEAPISKSEVHAFDESGKYVNSAKPGFDNRSIYYNANTGKIETVTYNVSSAVGFGPNTGIYALTTSETGQILSESAEIMQFNPAFGDAATMPSYDAANNRYFAKQSRSNKVLVVDISKREPVAEILLDFKTAGVAADEVSDSFVAFTGIKDSELVLLNIDRKAALVFDLSGKFIGKSDLPKTVKLRAKNYYNGLGYANDMLFVYLDSDGEFGTYYGYKIFK